MMFLILFSTGFPTSDLYILRSKNEILALIGPLKNKIQIHSFL